MGQQEGTGEKTRRLLSHKLFMVPNVQDPRESIHYPPVAPPYHISVIITHIDPLASGEPGLVLKNLLHKAQMTSVSIMEQAMGEDSQRITEDTPSSASRRALYLSPLVLSTSLHRDRGVSVEGPGQRGKRRLGTGKDGHRPKNVSSKVKRKKRGPKGGTKAQWIAQRKYHQAVH